jgi:ribosomal protein L11 methyltransferase
LTEPGNWVLTDLRMPSELAEIVSDALWAGGVAAIEEIEAEGFVVLRTSVDPGIVELVLASHPGVIAEQTSFSRTVADTWREHAAPSRVTDALWLVPAWSQPLPGTTALMIEPFDTFGLGNHPTTLLALRAALDHAHGASRVVDVGTGSGVLAVALSAVTGCRSTGTDIAPQSQAALRHNAELNGVGHLVGWSASTAGLDDGAGNLVVANILAPVLRDIAPELERVCAAGGTIVLSGMREEQVDGVVARFVSCRESSRTAEDGWAVSVLVRT